MSTPLRVLIVEDSEDDALLILRELRRGDYDPTFERVDTPDALNAALAGQTWDVVIADYSMPRFSGLDALRLLQESRLDLPFIVVSGTIGEDVAVAAMKAGAHDYVMKDNLARLVPAVRRELREAETRLARKQAEEALRESEGRYRQSVENSPNPIFSVDKKGILQTWNRACEQVFQYRSEEIIGQVYHKLLWNPADCPAVESMLAQVWQGHPLSDQDMTYRCKDGTQRFMASRLYPLRDYEGNVQECVLANTDITERARAEQLLRALNEAALAMERALTYDEIFAAVAEELKQLGFSCVVFSTDESQSRLFTQYLSYEAGALQAAEKLVGLQHEDFSIPIETIDVYRKVVWEKKIFFVENAEDIIRQVLPEPARRFAKQIAKMLKVPKSITAPLIVEDKVIGVLSVQSDDLTEEDIPAITAFAHQMAAAWRKAQLLEQARQEITERKRLEHEIEERRLYLESVLVCAPDAIATLDAQHNILKWNLGAERLFGYTLEEVVGRDIDELIARSNIDVFREATDFTRRVLTGGSVPPTETIRYRKDGSPVDVIVSGSPILIGNELVGVVAVYTDITERKRAEEVLKDNQEQLELITDKIPALLAYVDAGQRYLYVNQAYANWYGLSKQELIGKRVRDVLHEESYQGAIKQIETVLRGEEVSYENVIYDTDGQLRAVRATYVPHFDKSGQAKAFLGLVEDITERKRAEEERERLLAQIREQAQRVQQIIDTVPEGVLLLAPDGRVILANPLGKKDLAALAGAQVGDTLTRLGDRSLVELLTSPPKGLWHEVTTDDRHFEVIARPLDTELESEDWVLVVRDVTQEREVQRRVQRQERLAAVGQLAGGIAHDFNNLLTTIILYAQMGLGKHDLPPNVTRAFETIIGESRQAARLVQQILDFSRRSPIETHPVDLKPFVKEAIRVLQRTIPESIRLHFDVGPEEYVVDADPTRVQQVLMNLVVNARDAMPEGGDLRVGLFRVEVSPSEKPPVMEMVPGEWVCLAVADTGTGIAPEVLPRIFEPFFTTKPRELGTGLGLAQVYGIVTQHGGDIGVETRVGQGTTFRVYLPAYQAGEEEAPQEEAAPVAPEGKGETILLVEDNEGVREASRKILESLGYRVLAAANGREALEVYRAAGEADLVLADLVMPEMGGAELIWELRKTNPRLKALAITGYMLAEDLEQLKEKGILDVVYKPLDVSTLAQMVRSVLDAD